LEFPEVKTAFYWAIAKDMDSTLFVDYLGDRGFKEGLEYRYAFARDATGSARYAMSRTGDHELNLPWDFEAPQVPPSTAFRPLDEYIDFLEEIDALSSPPRKTKVFEEPFSL
jgi:hypothetical protein